MNFVITWVLNFFKKPAAVVETSFPFPVTSVEKPKRKPIAKKPAVVAKTVAKKKAKAKK